MYRQRFLGFTLIELLVVIGIVALLIGILLPVLSSAKQNAQMVSELAAGRQIAQAYFMYSSEHSGYVLPGYLDPTASNAPEVFAGIVRDDNGEPIYLLEPRRRYLWRLAPYVNYQLNGSIYSEYHYSKMLQRLTASGSSASNTMMRQYFISLFPTFGYNRHYVGGFPTNASYEGPGCLKLLDDANSASRQLIFASARGDSEVAGETEPGWDHVIAPNGPDRVWDDEFSEETLASNWGYVDPRWRESAAFVFLDGHVGLLGIEEMRDMTFWSNQARRVNDSDWTP